MIFRVSHRIDTILLPVRDGGNEVSAMAGEVSLEGVYICTVCERQIIRQRGIILLQLLLLCAGSNVSQVVDSNVQELHHHVSLFSKDPQRLFKIPSCRI